MEFNHVSVLLNECIEGLNIKPDGIYVDCTLGGAGHSKEIAKRLENGRLICFDQDKNAIEVAKERLAEFGEKVILVRSNFENIYDELNALGYTKVDGILADLGVSSHQLDEEERGFSYMADAILDMRMDDRQELDARYVVNNYSTEDLTRIISDYGEERWAKRIAEFISDYRSDKEIKTTGELVDIIKRAIPKKARQDGPHPAKRTFQAIRIEVNDELGVIERLLDQAVDILAKGGRICIITFHSLEDRIVKNKFKYFEQDCICPPELPFCNCDKKKEVKIITRKPILPSKEEVHNNPRSRSAKLRIAEKI